MLEILISSSVLILVLAVLRLVLKDRIPARLQYALWLLVLVRLLVPVSFFRSPVSAAGAAAPAVTRVEDFSRYAVSALPEYFTGAEDAGRTDPEDGKQTVTIEEAARVIWAAGMGIMAVWFLFVNARFALRLKRNRTPYDGVSDLPVYVAERIPSPCLFGLFRPAVYLTERAAEDDVQASQIIAHERTHFRHGDTIWALLRSVCLAVWWFNPLVWLAAALSRQDCELACDEGTIRALGEEARFEYGRTLVGMAKVGSRPSDLLCGATTMTTGKKSLKARVARIARAPKMSGTIAVIVLLIAAAAAGFTFSGAGEELSAPEDGGRDTGSVVKEEALPEETDAAVPASAADAAIGLADRVTVLAPKKENINEADPALYEVDLIGTFLTEKEMDFSITAQPEEYGFDFYAVLKDGTEISSTLVTYEFSEETGNTNCRVFWAEPVDLNELDHVENFGSVLPVNPSLMAAEPEVIGSYDAEYWEQVDRELASFAYPSDIEVHIEDAFDEALPEEDIFGPMTLEDYIYSTDGWKFRYSRELIANDPFATIKVYDADGRVLWIMDDADALMITEADGSVTWVSYTNDPVDCADMIRHLLPWARGEYPSEEALAQRAEAAEAAVRASVDALGSYGLPGLEPVKMEGGVETPFWADRSDPRNPAGPCCRLYFGTDEMSADMSYERMYQNGDPAQSLGTGSYVMCRSFFAESETVTDVKVGESNGFISEGSVYAGPRIVWYDAEADLLFSLIAYHFEEGQSPGSYTAEELVALAESVAVQ